jgi:phage terminase large subunit-like protein
VLSKKLRHGGNAVLRWMNSNVAIQQDPAGNKKPDKARSRDKIDGIVAGLMALGRATANGGQGPSVYEQRGVIVV